MSLAQPAPRVRVLAALRHRRFALLWSGQSLSGLGDSVMMVALAWLVYDLTGSPAAMASVMVLFGLPLVPLALVGGVVVDRMPRRTIMLASDVVRGLAVSAIAVLAASGQIQIWHVQALALVFGCARPFFEPAHMAMVPQLVPRDDLLPANSLASTSRFLAQIFGPLLGAAVIAVGGMAAAFAFDGAMLSLSALCLLAIRPAPPALPLEGPSDRRTTVWTEVREGFRTVLSATWLWFGIAIWSLIGALSQGSTMVLLPQLVRERLGGDVAALGALQSAFAIGMVGGTMAMGQIGMPRLRGVWYYIASAMRGLMLVGLGLVLDLPAAIGLFLISGAMLGIIVVIWESSLQELVPHRLQGRVRSIDMLGSFGLTPLGSAAAGIAAETLGPSVVFIGAGFVAAALSAGSLLVRGNRRFED